MREGVVVPVAGLGGRLSCPSLWTGSHLLREQNLLSAHVRGSTWG